MTITTTSQSEYKTACNGMIKDPTNYPHAEYRGKTIYFCSGACLRVFKEDPDAFMAGDVEHPLDEE